jgi:hypothetical protein
MNKNTLIFIHTQSFLGTVFFTIIKQLLKQILNWIKLTRVLDIFHHLIMVKKHVLEDDSVFTIKDLILQMS